MSPHTPPQATSGHAMELLERVLVIDYGTYEMKYGLSHMGGGDKALNMERVRTTVGVSGNNVPFIGRRIAAERRKGTVLETQCPAPRGFSENHDLSEKLWAYAFEQMGLSSYEQPAVITVPPRIPRDELENLTQIFFERFNVPALAVLPTPACAMFGAGRVSGIVLDVGESHTHASPVVNGVLQRYAVQSEPIGGAAVTQYFRSIVDGCVGPRPMHADDLNACAVALKEAACRCSLSYADATEGVVYPAGLPDRAGLEKEVQLTLPDGTELPCKINKERLMGGELLFRPAYHPHRRALLPVHEVLWNAVQSLHTSVARDCVESVVVCGGSTYCEGFSDRLVSEVECLTTSQLKPKVFLPRDRADIVWRGAAISCCLEQFESVWMTKEEYCDQGPSVVHSSQ
eukprot:TRINITY_DN9548_c0_g1_i2.p1 TRINITY_DN9548_c0_g1~~TRINITY_DN9548_c0_g1_i2.p1  ORF type:complete len:401 (+),score=133.57 TRINITY_DN9548_c0_g1_i2:655-1857(+)